MTTRLRYLLLPLAGSGFLLFSFGKAPDIVVSEDGKLVAVRAGDQNLYVNRPRPNRFTAQNWARAYGAERVIAPDSSGQSEHGFKCREGICQISSVEGILIARIEERALLSAGCEEYDILIVTFPLQRRTCAHGKAFVISARDLARLGSVEITIATGQAGSRNGYVVTRALSGIERPWHQHRAFSRAARDLDPYVPKPKPATTLQTSG